MALDLYAGIRVGDYHAAKSWYERLLGREPTFVAYATEAVWELAEHRYLFIEQDREAPGGAMVTIFGDDLDALAAGHRLARNRTGRARHVLERGAAGDLSRRRGQRDRLGRHPPRAS